MSTSRRGPGSGSYLQDKMSDPACQIPHVGPPFAFD